MRADEALLVALGEKAPALVVHLEATFASCTMAGARSALLLPRVFCGRCLPTKRQRAVSRLLPSDEAYGPVSILPLASSWHSPRSSAAGAPAAETPAAADFGPDSAARQEDPPVAARTAVNGPSHGPARRRRRRLDELCVERYPHFSRSIIQSWILQGKVLVRGQPVYKAGAPVAADADVRIIAEVPKYVCRAGYKLEGALAHFGLDVSGKVVLDAGLSTGGFADCLLQNGAARVYGVDVGYGQVSEKIRTDERVVVMERTNLRHLARLPEPVDLATLDLSFISLLLVMPAVRAVMKPDAALVTLIKPQFEARRGQVGGGGIVRDPAVHKEVVSRVTEGIEAAGFSCQGCITSPITGTDGNVEFLAYFTRTHSVGA